MKKALCVLIHHNLVIYHVHKRSVVEYEAQCSRVLRMLRYPRYIYTTKTLYSDTGELIVEELLLNGKMTMSAVVKKVADRLTETMEGQYWVYSSERKPRLAGSAVLLGPLTCLFPPVVQMARPWTTPRYQMRLCDWQTLTLYSAVLWFLPLAVLSLSHHHLPRPLSLMKRTCT